MPPAVELGMGRAVIIGFDNNAQTLLKTHVNPDTIPELQEDP
jgi:hypothetical protein